MTKKDYEKLARALARCKPTDPDGPRHVRRHRVGHRARTVERQPPVQPGQVHPRCEQADVTPETKAKLNTRRLRQDPDYQFRRHQRAVAAATYHKARTLARVVLHSLTGVQR